MSTNTNNTTSKSQSADAPQTVNVINTDPVIQFLDRKSQVSAEELATLTQRGATGDVLVGGSVTYTDGGGKTISRPKTISDVNGHLTYAKVEVDSLKNNPVFMNGWFPAKRDNDGGKGIPSHYFDANGYVFFGESLLVWTPKDFFNQRFIEPHKNRLIANVSRVSGGLGSTGVDQDFSVTKD